MNCNFYSLGEQKVVKLSPIHERSERSVTWNSTARESLGQRTWLSRETCLLSSAILTKY